jgi:poly-beta-1,6-N-acetyl-D-glucosamine synthase
MDKVITILFLSCSVLCLSVFSYPLVTVLSRLLTKQSLNKSNYLIKPVSIIIAAYNEELVIRDKILSIIDKEEWIEGSELIIVSAGSTDNTNVILNEFRDHRDILLMIYEKHLTKIECINLAVSRSRNDILVFSDCRQQMKRGSIKRLLYNFNDQSVGTVTSTLINIKGRNTSRIRSVLNRIALTESMAGSCLNVFGALYAQRKSVYRTIPTDIIFDDLFVVVSTLAQNKRLIQENESIIYDLDFDRYYNKERIERLARGLLIFLWNHGNLIRELPAGVLIRFIVYKYLKLLFPLLLSIMLFCSVYLVIRIMCLQVMAIGALLLIGVFGVKASRDLIFLLMRINLYFMAATCKFLFLNGREISWRKLEVEPASGIDGANEDCSIV